MWNEAVNNAPGINPVRKDEAKMRRSLTRLPTMRLPQVSVIALLALSACGSETLDWDLRSNDSGTADAALQATSAPPQADANGVLSYPDFQVAVARKGDTVASVAARVGINGAELARHNALKPEDALREGEVLALPVRVAAAPAGTGSSAQAVDVTSIATTALDRVGDSPLATPLAQPGGAEPARHQVRRGETAFSIARTYNVSAKSLADWNGLGPDLAVREGQYLIIPTATAAAPVIEAEPALPGTGSATPEPPSAREPLPDEQTAPAAEPVKQTPASPDLAEERTAASATSYLMPVDGKIIRGYAKGKNDGIAIAAAAGTPVKAAADGTVAAITTDTEGTQIVVLRHADGLLTLYVGVAGVKVTKGATVKRGQTIAEVRAGDPAFLHFEVRNGMDSVDPMLYLQ